MIHHLSIILTLATFLTGCATQPSSTNSSVTARPNLEFVDLSGFDQSLSSSLNAALPRVEVSFYDKVTPSVLPERLQKWMAAVESGGGKVKVLPPPSTVTSRSPLLLISAVTTLWSANDRFKTVSTESRLGVAKNYDAELVLKQDDRGNTLVDKVVFIQRDK